MTNILKEKKEIKLFDKLDIKIASILEKKNNLLLLIFALLSAKTRNGHVCLDIKKINTNHYFKNKEININPKIRKLFQIKYKDKINILKKSNAVCNSKKLKKPLVLSKNKLYFQKMWIDEKIVANFFKQNSSCKINKKKLKKILNEIFQFSKNKNWQIIATIIAIINKITIISGGPGTGKTTIITYILYTLIKLNKKKIKIIIGAPTGKSAEKITQSLNKEIKKLKLNKKIPQRAQTIHQILKFQPNQGNFFHNKKNPLIVDILILDEASMIGLSMMAKIIESINNHTKVILLGDKNQLPSIEPGFIFNNLCYFSKFKYSSKTAKKIQDITGYKIKNNKSNIKNKIQDNICILKKNYRFKPKSEIGLLSHAINKCNINKIKKILNKKNKNISFNNICNLDEYKNLVYKISKKYKKYFNEIKKKKNKRKILDYFNKYRVLVATKKKYFGTTQINKKIEDILYHKKYIKKINKSCENYEGRPIIITENNYTLSIFNGETGIILKEKNNFKAFFYKTNKSIKKIKVSCLPKHETAYSITVHKSQGSEFDHICLILPPIFDINIKKELIYTAITRAKKKITIYANLDIFIKTIMNKTQRCSGLIEKLYSR